MGRQSYRNHNIDNCLFLKKERQQSARGFSRAFEADEYDEHCQDYYDECYNQDEEDKLLEKLDKIYHL